MPSLSIVALKKEAEQALKEAENAEKIDTPPRTPLGKHNKQSSYLDYEVEKDPYIKSVSEKNFNNSSSLQWPENHSSLPSASSVVVKQRSNHKHLTGVSGARSLMSLGSCDSNESVRSVGSNFSNLALDVSDVSKKSVEQHEGRGTAQYTESVGQMKDVIRQLPLGRNEPADRPKLPLLRSRRES